MKNFRSFAVAVSCMLLTAVSSFAGAPNRWLQLDNSRISIQGTRHIVPVRYQSFVLNVEGLRQDFLNASGSQSRAMSVTVPDPNGVMHEFRVFPAEVMHPDLAARYPEIVTFSGVSLSDPSVTARFDFTQFGFHAMMLAPGKTWFIDPYSLEDTDEYMVYFKRDFTTTKSFDCLVDESLEHSIQHMNVAKSIGSELKTYRLAMAATGEYTAFYGGTVAGALAGIVTSVNRVTGVYEREFAIRMTLVPNTDTLIFTNANTDPYTNSSGGTMLGQNQTTVTARIGAANYDIGHVFSTGGGGIAGLGVVCNFSQKARGVTGSSAPIGDPFDIDYVAHEIGHQFGGNHTFNAETGACSGNRAFNAAYEPGSGSTIMAYAGICSGNNLQPNSDDYFHTKSFDEITIYTTTGVGSNCPVVTQTGNTPPTINPGGNYIIPYLTPFKLTGSATDPDGDSLTYCWEQYDLGPGGTWNAPVGNAPIFRSFDPTPNPVRLFPKLSNILNNNQTIGEVKPSYARTLHFKLTVRDNRLNGGGVTNNDTPIAVDVINSGQPFAITSPNTTGILWSAGGVETVTWDVANTDQSPISTPNVNILLSTDGGQTFPTVLASNIPNNGSAQVNVPNITTTTARVWVEGAGNIFFDINDKNFAIGPVGINEAFGENGVLVAPNPAADHLNITLDRNSVFQPGITEVMILDLSGRLVYTQWLEAQSTRVSTSDLATGMYVVRLVNTNGHSSSGRVIIGWQR